MGAIVFEVTEVPICCVKFIVCKNWLVVGLDDFQLQHANTFISACLDHTIKMWSLGSGSANFTMDAHDMEGSVGLLANSPIPRDFR